MAYQKIEIIRRFEHSAGCGPVILGPGVRLDLSTMGGYIDTEGYAILPTIHGQDDRIPPTHFKLVDEYSQVAPTLPSVAKT